MNINNNKNTSVAISSVTFIKNFSYMVMYNTTVSIKGNQVPVHYLLYLEGKPRELRDIYLEHKHKFTLPIVYVMEKPSIFSRHSVVVEEMDNKKLYMFNGGL